MLFRNRPLWKLGLLLALAPLLTAASPPPVDEEIERCVRANLPEKTSVQVIRLVSTDRVGDVRKTEAEIFWHKGRDGLSESLLLFSDPHEMRGARLLLLEGEEHIQAFMYSPELHKPRRITGRMLAGPIAGSDFTYEDFLHLWGLRDRVQGERLPDQVLDGVPVYVVASRTDEDPFGYERVVTYLQKENCVPLRQEYFETGDRLRKRMTIERAAIRPESAGDRSIWVARRLLMYDVRDETRTELIVDEVRLDVPVKRVQFSQGELEKGR
jgi:hypothetical protein